MPVDRKTKDSTPQFFARPADFRRWLAKNHQRATELLVGFHKKASGRPSISWPESVDEALCYGWIDGVRRSIDEASYTIRFTPRRSGSTWSAKNIARARELIALGRMTPAGQAAFERRKESRLRRYSYEQDGEALAEALERDLRTNAAAWEYFQAQPPYYRRQTLWWVASARREETQKRRLQTLIESSAAGRMIPPFRAGKNR